MLVPMIGHQPFLSIVQIVVVGHLRKVLALLPSLLLLVVHLPFCLDQNTAIHQTHEKSHIFTQFYDRIYALDIVVLQENLTSLTISLVKYYNCIKCNPNTHFGLQVKCLDWKLDEWKAYARCKQHTSIDMNIIALCLAHCPIITKMLVAIT